MRTSILVSGFFGMVYPCESRYLSALMLLSSSTGVQKSGKIETVKTNLINQREPIETVFTVIRFIFREKSASW
jgi:hypothetical protein